MATEPISEDIRVSPEPIDGSALEELEALSALCKKAGTLDKLKPTVPSRYVDMRNMKPTVERFLTGLGLEKNGLYNIVRVVGEMGFQPIDALIPLTDTKNGYQLCDRKQRTVVVQFRQMVKIPGGGGLGIMCDKSQEYVDVLVIPSAESIHS